MYVKYPALIVVPMIFAGLDVSLLMLGEYILLPLTVAATGFFAWCIFSKDPVKPYVWPKVSFRKDEYGIDFVMTYDGEQEVECLRWSTIAEHLPVNYKRSGSEKIVYQSSIWHVLGIMPTNDRTKVMSAFKKMSLVYHPYVGGDCKAFNECVSQC